MLFRSGQNIDIENRFLLHLTPSGVNEMINESPLVYYSNQMINVFNPWSGKSILSIYDSKAQFIQSYYVKKGKSSLSFLSAQGVYIIKLLNENHVFVKKEVVY